MIIFLSGLSAVGKTTTAEAFVARHTEFRHVVASRLIKGGGASIRPSSRADLDRNQKILLREFRELRHTSAERIHLILDGHMVIETREGEELIEDKVIDGLQVSHFIVITDDPYRIYSTRRRGSSGRPISLDTIQRLQMLEIDATRRQAERCGSPSFEVQSGDVEALERIFGLDS